MFSVTIRFYGPLDRICRWRGPGPERVISFPAPRSVMDLIEAGGIPHTEVGMILVNDTIVPPAHTLLHGDRISVLPPFCSPALSGWNESFPPKSPPAIFVADVHLGTLARRLRLLGLDCLYNKHCGDRDLAAISRTEQRILLTRDRGLLMRREVRLGILIRSERPDKQVIEVIDRLSPLPAFAPYTRCLECNGLLQPVDLDCVVKDVPAGAALLHRTFSRCAGCGQVYWPGSHVKAMDRWLHRVQDHAERLKAWSSTGPPT